MAHGAVGRFVRAPAFFSGLTLEIRSSIHRGFIAFRYPAGVSETSGGEMSWYALSNLEDGRSMSWRAISDPSEANEGETVVPAAQLEGGAPGGEGWSRAIECRGA